MGYLFDESKSLTIDKVVKREFTQKISNRFALGYLKGVNWFKLEIKNRSSNEDFVIVFNEVLFERVNLYSFIDGTWQVDKNGFKISLKEKSFRSIKPTFKIHLPKNSTATFYIETYSKFSNLGEFHIHEYDYFVTEHDTFMMYLYLFYFGILSTVILFNLFLYIRFEESIYIYYVGYTFFFSLFVMLFSGVILYLGLEFIHYELHFAPPLFILFLMLFSNKFLRIKHHLPKIHLLIKVSTVILTLLAILIVIDVEPWYHLMNVFATIAFIILIVASIGTMRRGEKKSKYYLMVISIYLLTMVFMSSMVNGWIEYNYFNRYAYLYGSCFEIVFFSLMLANRFYESQNEKIKISEELMEIKNENELYLIQEVENRTNEIKEMNIELLNVANEREMLLKELYHRVKNNFQMVTSLLWMESNKIQNEDTKLGFMELINRIKSMSVLHDYLYSTKNLSAINSSEYVSKLIDEVQAIYEDRSVKIYCDINDFQLKINDAMYLGMTINELLNNAIKHYEGEEVCTLNIYFKKYGKKYLLSIQDNGKGFDSNELNAGLGMGLINQFASKLHKSEHIFINNSGTRFELSFED